MVALVMFPDTDTLARKVVLQGLAEHGTTGIAVGTKLPSPMQNRFIRCYTIPGRQLSPRTMQCQVIAQVYDTKGNDVRCRALAETVTEILASAHEMVVDGEQQISAPIERHGPIPYEDPDWPGIPRWQGTVFFTVQSTVSA